jgi:S1-C subfamily serine protease
MPSNVLQQWVTEQGEFTARAATGVVAVEASRRRSLSGIAWDAETVVTAAEPLACANRITVHTGTESLAAEVIGLDLATDVAVLRARTSVPAPARTDSAALRAGQPVLVAGRDVGGAVVAWSHVQYLGPAWRSRRGGDIARGIRFAPALDAVLEGGGVFESGGRLCAMAVLGPRGRVLGIPAETVAGVVERVAHHGYLPQPYLGLRLQPVLLDEALRAQLERQRGPAVIVIGVDPESPAMLAGMVFGDLVLAVAGEPVATPIDVTRQIGRVAIGSPVAIELLRAGVRQFASVVIGERPRG